MSRRRRRRRRRRPVALALVAATAVLGSPGSAAASGDHAAAQVTAAHGATAGTDGDGWEGAEALASTGPRTAAADAPRVAGARAVDEYTDVVPMTVPLPRGTYRYSDDFFGPRSRGHHGSLDLMARRGTRIRFARSGVVRWVSTPDTSTCGYCIFVDGDDGRQYGYIHMGPKEPGRLGQAFARRWAPGDQVWRGQLLGYVGCSGNATCGGGEHLHFQISQPGMDSPAGDGRVNPFHSVRAAERRGDWPGRRWPQPTVALAGDVDGDGRDEPLLFNGGTWAVLDRELRTRQLFVLGRPGDVPLVGDFDGDGDDTVGLRRGRVWRLDRDGDARVDRWVEWGGEGATALVGDFDGDGVDTFALRRRNVLRVDADGDGRTDRTLVWGRTRDTPVVGDVDGDGRDTLGLHRRRDGQRPLWLLDADGDGRADQRVAFGRADDAPLLADMDHDGRDAPARPRGRRWFGEPDARGRATVTWR